MTEEIADIVSSWQPAAANQTFQKAFHARCLYEENLLIARSQFEIDSRAHNFASGPPIEALFRDFFRRMLPRRYAVECSHVIDTLGQTAGECDIVVYDDSWFPSIRARVADDDRYSMVSVESVYGIVEVKQTLDMTTLDQAMKKLVTCSRLSRVKRSISETVSENRSMGDFGDLTVGNPLFTGIVAARLGDVTETDILTRFVQINKQLKRHEVVRSICVLGELTTLWGFRPPGTDGKDGKIASFSFEDLDKDLHLGLAAKRLGDSPLAVFSAHLLDSINFSTLDPNKFAERYGAFLQPKLIDPNHKFILLATGMA